MLVFPLEILGSYVLILLVLLGLFVVFMEFVPPLRAQGQGGRGGDDI